MAMTPSTQPGIATGVEEETFNRQPAITRFGTISAVWEMSDPHAQRVAFTKRAARGAKRALGKRDVIRIEPTVAPTIHIPEGIQPWRRLLIETALKHGVTPAEIIGLQRAKTIAAARHETMWRMKTETTMSLTAIGRRLNRDHTTVLSGVRRHAAKLEAQNASKAE